MTKQTHNTIFGSIALACLGAGCMGVGWMLYEIIPWEEIWKFPGYVKLMAIGFALAFLVVWIGKVTKTTD